MHLDKDSDGFLSYDEFRKFLRPEDDAELRQIEIHSIIEEYDDNADGRISNDEYLKMTGRLFI
jgi:Ca2+-binding EF-hand superfamily protein